MLSILPSHASLVKERLLKHLRRCRDASLRVRYLIIINLLNKRGAYETAVVLGVHNTTVYRVADRFKTRGEVGLLDRREDNGEAKLDEHFLASLDKVVRSTPTSCGWKRPTWTREMLVETLAHRTGVRIHVTTMSRALALIKARRARPRPVVQCPWSKSARERRLEAIRHVLKHLPRGHLAFYEDEVDVHLNPKIGLDWMGYAQQKKAITPGKNVKRYLAGALDIRTGLVYWVDGERKNSDLFVRLLHYLSKTNPTAKVIHIVLDNYRIHDSKLTQMAVANFGGHVQLHFLPPYCPNDNKIERIWEDLHANVTRNHICSDIDTLMQNVVEYLQRRNRQQIRNHHCRAA
jgi:transposase